MLAFFLGSSLSLYDLIEKLKVGEKMKYTGENHIILIGWSDKSKLAIQEILLSDKTINIVVIDNLEKAPMTEERLFYVRGDATDEETLLRANLFKAKAGMIFAHQIKQGSYTTRETVFVDGKTLLIATAITAIRKKMNTPVHITAEVMNQKHIHLFKHVKVDEFILAQETLLN